MACWLAGSPTTLVSPSLFPGRARGCICALAPSPDWSLMAVLRDTGELQVWSGGPHHVLLGATMTFGALAHGAAKRHRRSQRAAENSDGVVGGGIEEDARPRKEGIRCAYALAWRHDSADLCL